MTKLEIYNLALAQHAKKCTADEMTAQNKPHEVDACDQMFEIAVENVLGEFDWSFCVVPIEIDYEDDEPYGDWEHGYRLPGNLIRIARVDNSGFPFMVASKRLYCNESRPAMWGIPMNVKCIEYGPRDFCALVGLWLAYLISPILSPSDANLSNRILQTYSAQLQTLMKRELNSVQDNYLDEDDWGRKF